MLTGTDLSSAIFLLTGVFCKLKKINYFNPHTGPSDDDVGEGILIEVSQRQVQI